ncbi:hypothetical protein MTP04_07640 [Lysinibacillus sp. PLM2]|nr:hypothetical protein MTP04_07640 [Lysinibacillus sp. PLM2]
MVHNEVLGDKSLGSGLNSEVNGQKLNVNGHNEGEWIKQRSERTK